MPSISTTQAQGEFTQAVVDVYKERISPLGFLRSFFPEKAYSTRYLDTRVRRGSEKVAVDIMRGADPNYLKFDNRTQHIYEPPYYRPGIFINEMDAYTSLFGSETISDSKFAEFAEEVGEELAMARDTIERAYELQCAQVLEDGIVTMTNGNNIDFQRKALSKVDIGSGNYWTTGSNNPITHIETGCQYLRKEGKATGSIVNMIAGNSALNALLNNTTFKTRADIRNFSLDSVRAPQRNAAGGTLHGIISAGSYNVLIWAYEEYYEDSNNTLQPYLDPNKIILLPENPRFRMAYAAVPQLPDGTGRIVTGAYVMGEYKDTYNAKHEMDIKSAGLAIPVAVDQIYTAKVV